MQDRDEEKLEGLLKARSVNLGRRRLPRPGRHDERPGAASAARSEDDSPAGATGRACGDCGAAILPRRLRAIPRATRCLDCQREFEQAPAAG